MIIEEFACGNTSIHKIDPRIKIFVSIIFSLVIAFSSKIIVLILGMLLSILLILLARLNFAKVLKKLLIVNLFIVPVWIFLPFTLKGEPIYNYGNLTLTYEGLIYTLMITIKSNTIVLFLTVMLSTSKTFSILHALSYLYIPEKLIHLFFLSFRYIHVIHSEFCNLSNAMRIRCFKPGTNIHTYKTYAYLIGMLLIKSYDRSERIYNAMLLRGFKGRFYMLDSFILKRKDILFLSFISIYVIGLIWLQWIGVVL